MEMCVLGVNDKSEESGECKRGSKGNGEMVEVRIVRIEVVMRVKTKVAVEGEGKNGRVKVVASVKMTESGSDDESESK